MNHFIIVCIIVDVLYLQILENDAWIVVITFCV